MTLSLQKIHSLKVNLKNKIYKWNLISEKLIWSCTAFYLGEGPCRININPKPSTSTKQALFKCHSKLSWCIALISNGSSVYQNWVKPYDDTMPPLGVGSFSKEKKMARTPILHVQLCFREKAAAVGHRTVWTGAWCGESLLGTAFVNCWVPLSALKPHSW